MINSSMRRAVAVALLAGASVAANATPTNANLGTVALDIPTTFTGSVLASQSSFSDIFNFTLAEPNKNSGFNVINFPLTVPNSGSFNTVLSTMSLVSAGADGVQGGGDDVVLKSTVLPSTGNTSDHLSLAWGEPLHGPAYLNITGVTDGSLGGLYSGSIAISAVPEPESLAMLLAGLGLMGAVVRRRSKHKG